MRGLNIKKLAAVALGTALVGATVAPLVSAMDNSSSITKGDIVSLTSGLPTVSLVVGAGAGTSDAVWAGNIAATIAQLATVEKSVSVDAGSIADAQVDLSIGGTTSYSKEYSKTFDSEYLMSLAATTSEFLKTDANTSWAYGLTSSSLPYLVNTTYQYRWDKDGTSSNYSSATTNITIKEKVGFESDVKFDTQEGITDLIASVKTSDFYYEIDLGAGIPAYHASSTTAWGTSFTDTDKDNIVIPLFGEDYTVQSIDATSTPTKITLVKNSGKATYYEGQTIEGLVGKGDYSNEDLKVKVVAVTQAGPASSTYSVKLELYDSEDNLVDTQTVGSSEFANQLFVDSEGAYVLDTVFYISDLGLESTSGTGYVTATVGNNVVEIANSKVFPYDSTDTTTSDDYWRATITTTANSGTPASGTVGKVTNIKIENYVQNWTKADSLRATDYSFTDDGTSEISLMEGYDEDTIGYGYAKLVFTGFKGDKERTAFSIGDGKFTFTDMDGLEREVPFYMEKSVSHDISSYFQLAGKDYYYKCYKHDTNTSPTTVMLHIGDTFNGYRLTEADINRLSDLADASTTYIGDATAGHGFMKITKDSNSTAWGPILPMDKNVTIHTDLACMFSKVDFDSTPATTDYMYRWDANATWNALEAPLLTDSKYTYVSFDNNFYNATTPIRFTHGETNESSIMYRMAAYNDELFLLLDTNTNIIPEFSDKTVGLDVEFLGTDIGENLAPDINYYVPNISELGAGSSPSTDYYIAQFNLSGETATAASRFGVWYVPIDTYTGDIVIPGDNLSAWTYKLAYDATGTGSNDFNMAIKTRTDFTKAYSDYGVKAELDSGVATFSIPEQKEYLSFSVLGEGAVTSTAGGTEFTDLEIGKAVEKNNLKVTVTAVDGSISSDSATYNAIVPLTTRLVYQDSELAPAGSHIIVGGYMVNELAQDVVLTDGSTLQEALVSTGDYVVDVLDNGDIVVAGYTSDDTITAAKNLISALEDLM